MNVHKIDTLLMQGCKYQAWQIGPGRSGPNFSWAGPLRPKFQVDWAGPFITNFP